MIKRPVKVQRAENKTLRNDQYQVEANKQFNTIYDYLDENVSETGWIDMSSYVTSTKCSIRPDFKPEVKIKNGLVHWRGQLYCSTAMSDNTEILLSNIPKEYLPEVQMSGCGNTFIDLEPYFLLIERSTAALRVNRKNLTTQGNYKGFVLEHIPPYPVN